MQETALNWFDLGTGDEKSFFAFKENAEDASALQCW